MGLSKSGPISGMVLWSSLIWVYTVCICFFVRNLSVRNFRTFTVTRKKIFGFNSGVVLISSGLNSGFTVYAFKQIKFTV